MELNKPDLCPTLPGTNEYSHLIPEPSQIFFPPVSREPTFLAPIIASLSGDPWSNQNQALRQLGVAARLGPKGELPGGLRPKEHGIVITANKAPPFAKIKLEKIKIKRKKKPKEKTKEDKEDMGTFSVLPDIRKKSGDSMRDKDSAKKSSAEKKRSKTSVPEMSKPKSVKPKNGKEKPSKSAKSEGGKSDGAKSDGTKSMGKGQKKKGSPIKRPPPRAAKGDSENQPKVKNSGMSWAITFDDELEPDPEEKGKLDKEGARETKSDMLNKQDIPSCKKVQAASLSSKRPSSSGGVKKKNTKNAHAGVKITVRRPSSAGLAKAGNSKGVDFLTDQPSKSKSNTKQSAGKDKSFTQKKRPTRPLSAKLEDSKAPVRKGSLDKPSISGLVDFDISKPNSKLVLRPSSAGLARRSSFDMDKLSPPKSKKAFEETPAEKALKQKGGSNAGADSGYNSSVTMSSLSMNDYPPIPVASPEKSQGNALQEQKKESTQTEIQDEESDIEEEEEIIELTEKMKGFVNGNFPENMEHPRTSVRIFLSSTFSDMKSERNSLINYSYPELTEYCRKFGLDFQTVDMRWGVTDEAGNDHKTSTLCVKEIEICKRVSVGPNYVLFLGNRYGSRPIPSVISLEEYDILSAVIKEKGLDDNKLLETWFKLDSNNIPATYNMLPITSVIPDYGNQNDTEKRKAASKKWDEINVSLSKILREAAAEAFTRGSLSEERKHIYYRSVTEEEIEHGLFKSSLPDEQTLLYTREMPNLKDHLDDDIAWKWIDVEEKDGKNQPDEEALELLHDLKYSRAPAKLIEQNRHTFEVTWYGNGVEPEKHPDHEQYLKHFASRFTVDMKRLIDKAVQDRKKIAKEQKMDKDPTLIGEILHHGLLARRYRKCFYGQERPLNEIKDYLTTNMDKQKSKIPLIVTGNAGSGVSALMAKTAELIPQWINTSNSTNIIRFGGITPASCDLHKNLNVVCQQISLCYKERIPAQGDLSSVHKASRYFRNLIETLEVKGKLKEQPLVVVFDSVEKLSMKSKIEMLQWMPTAMCENFFMVLSCCPDNPLLKIMDLVSRRNDGSLSKVINIDGIEGSGQMLKDILREKGRTILEEQFKLLCSVFEMDSSALLTSVIVEEACLWKSYDQMSDLQIGKTIENAIDILLSRVEADYGSTLVSFSLSYVTACPDGISEAELEDVLSCNDEIMDAVYQYHNPPIEGVVRIPSLLWSRVRNALGQYLLEVMVGKKTVISWMHGQFKAAAEKKYIHCHKEKSEAYLQRIHKDLAEIFDAETSVKRTITLHNRKITVKNADRQTKPQPLNTENLRKLQSFPFHLGKSNCGIDTIKEKLFCNFKWLQTKLKAVGLKDVLSDFKDYDNKDEESLLVMDMLVMAAKSLTQDASSLSSEIIGRMPSLGMKFAGIKSLVDDALQAVSTVTDPKLVPLYPCLLPPGKMLKGASGGIKEILDFDDKCEGGRLLAKLISDQITVWDVSDNEIIANITSCADSDSLWTFSGTKHDFLVRCDGKRFSVFYSYSGSLAASFEPFPLTAKSGPGGQIISMYVIFNTGMTSYCVGKYEPVIYQVDMMTKKLVHQIDGRDKSLEEQIKKEFPDDDISSFNTRKTHSIPGHLSEITYITCSSKNDTLITADDSVLCLWRTNDNELVKTLYYSNIASVVLSEDESMLIITTENQIIVIRVPETTVASSILATGEDTRISCPQLSLDNRYITCGVGRDIINIYKLEDGSIVQSLSRNSRFYPTKLLLDRTNQFVFGDGAGGLLRVWHIPSGDLVLDSKVFTETITTMYLLKDSCIVTMCSGEETLKVFDLLETFMLARFMRFKSITDEKIKAYEKEQVGLWHQKTQKAISQVDKGEIPYSCGIDLIQFYKKIDGENQTNSGTEIKHLSYDASMKCAYITGNGQYVVTIDTCGWMKVWNLTEGNMERSAPAEGCIELQLANNDKLVIGIVRKKPALVSNIKIWDFATLETLPIDGVQAEEELPIQAMAVDSTDDFLYGVYPAMMGGMSLYVIDLSKRMLRYVLYLDGPTDITAGSKGLTARLNMEESHLILGSKSSSWDGTAFSSYNIAGVLSTIDRMKKKEGETTGELMVEELGQCSVELAGGKAIVHIQPISFTIGCDPFLQTVVISKDNELITGTEKGEILIWDITECKMLKKLDRCKKHPEFHKPCKRSGFMTKITPGSVHKAAVVSLHVSRDGQTLVAGSADHSISVWDLTSGSLQLILNGHKDIVRSAKISDDKKYIVTGSKDQSVRLWDIKSGKQLCLMQLECDIYEVTLSRSNKTIMARGDKGVSDKLFLLKTINI